MYTKENSQQTLKVPTNNLEVRFERADQNHYNEILQSRKGKQDKPQYMMVKFQNVMILMIRPTPGLFCCAVISTCD